MEIVEVKKHNIDTFDIYINIKDRLSYEDIKFLDKIVKEETDRYIEFLGIDKAKTHLQNKTHAFSASSFTSKPCQ